MPLPHNAMMPTPSTYEESTARSQKLPNPRYGLLPFSATPTSVLETASYFTQNGQKRSLRNRPDFGYHVLSSLHGWIYTLKHERKNSEQRTRSIQTLGAALELAQFAQSMKMMERDRFLEFVRRQVEASKSGRAQSQTQGRPLPHDSSTGTLLGMSTNPDRVPQMGVSQAAVWWGDPSIPFQALGSSALQTIDQQVPTSRPPANCLQCNMPFHLCYCAYMTPRTAGMGLRSAASFAGSASYGPATPGSETLYQPELFDQGEWLDSPLSADSNGAFADAWPLPSAYGKGILSSNIVQPPLPTHDRFELYHPKQAGQQPQMATPESSAIQEAQGSAKAGMSHLDPELDQRDRPLSCPVHPRLGKQSCQPFCLDAYLSAHTWTSEYKPATRTDKWDDWITALVDVSISHIWDKSSKATRPRRTWHALFDSRTSAFAASRSGQFIQVVRDAMEAAKSATMARSLEINKFYLLEPWEAVRELRKRQGLPVDGLDPPGEGVEQQLITITS